MFFLQHYLKVIRKIFSSEYPYAKILLLVSYNILILRSVVHHKMKLFRNRAAERKAFFSGSTVHFLSWPHTINLFEEIFVFQVYRFSNDNSSPSIIDCGSNIGVSMLYFKKLFPQCRIIGFEPDKESFMLLEKNVNENNLKDVELHNIALHNAEGEMELHGKTGKVLNMSLIYSGEKVFSQTVIAKKLSDFIVDPVDFLKIDVEGSEVNIIDDLIIQDKIHLVRSMIIEYHPQITCLPAQEFIKKIESCGFRVSVMQSELHEFASDVMMVVNRI